MSQDLAESQSWDAYMAPWEEEFAHKNQYKLSFEKECHFAKQMMLRNSGLMKCVQQNPVSLHDALMNASSIGVSLNPALKNAYLVPRDRAVCLDVSYMGLVALACEAGLIVMAKAVLVHGPRGDYQGDVYRGHGPITAPTHEYDLAHPDRVNGDDPLENLLCGYSLALLPSGVIIVDEMSAAEIFAVRATSKAFTSGRSCPWKGPWSGEMAKKTLIKRGSKSWPKGGDRVRLDTAIHVINQHEGLKDVTEAAPEQANAPLCISHEQSEDLHAALQVSGMSEAQFCTKAGIAGIDSLPAARYEGAKAFLQQHAQRGLIE